MRRSFMERAEGSLKFPIGTPIPSFSLPNVDGTSIDTNYLKDSQAALVVFACNHCPYVVGSEKMLFDTIREFQQQGLKAVLISSNDPVKYPEDSFDKMKEKAKLDSIPCPYLFDESQDIARAFDAQCTPECYLFDESGKLVFHGTINNSPRDPGNVKTNYLKAALDQLFGNKKPDPSFVHPIGCSIKWR